MSRKSRIHALITQQFAPTHLEVEDESHHHHVPEGSESHFKITAVSAQFASLTRIARHRLLNTLLKTEFEQGLHALSMHLYTLEEWLAKGKTVLESPKCQDGFEN